MGRRIWPKGKPKRWARDAAPIGAVDTRVRGVRMIKVRMDGPKSSRWINLARWRWEQLYGPVPPGKRVVHLDGDSLNDDPANYALMTGGEWLVHLRKLRKGMAEKNRRRCSAATAEMNRLRGAIRRGVGAIRHGSILPGISSCSCTSKSEKRVRS